ncbi:MAG: prepilin-type N-terminal cleavage/methylation domain-containing protein [Acidobacteriia bacterium]|nr:prepilin-type N-terminal cleavage/methylation domain-containing protein [Terriglobia bacterium]
MKSRLAARKAELGFTLIEVLISVMVLTVGLVSLLAVFGLAVSTTQTAQDDMIAKQEASEALESIFTARNTSQISWAQILNVADGGIFLNGFQPIKYQGADGLDGTADDTADPDPRCPGPSQCIKMPGPDGLLGTADDIYLPLNNFQRQIAITPLNDQSGNQYSVLRQITITIRYSTSQNLKVQKTYVMTAYISQYR